MKRYLILIMLLAAILVACGGVEKTNDATVDTTDDMSETDSADDATDVDDDIDPDSSDEVVVSPTLPPAVFVDASDELKALLPAYEESDIITTESELRYVILEEGEGDTAATCDTIDAHYTGYLPDGTKFDSSRDRDQTFQFPIGQGSVIAGWDEGFALLAPGAKAILMIPPQLGYGEQGGGTIPPNSTLYFDVELVSVDAVASRADVDDDDYVSVANDVRYAVIEEGDGKVIDEDRVLVFDFVLWDTNPTGCPLANSETSGRPISFQMNDDNMFQAMLDGVEGVSVGEQRQIEMPEEALEGAGFQPGDYTFLVTLSKTLAPPPESPEELDTADFTEVEDAEGILYYDIAEGDGDEVAVGDSVDVVYHVWTADGEMVTSSIYAGQEVVPVQIGLGQLPGLDEALPGAKIGGTRQVIVPADVVGPLPGTGESADVIFEVELIGMSEVE